MAQLSLSNVSKVYPGRVTAVENFNLDVADGEFIVLVGPSGCGKTTTLRMVAGLEDVSIGTIRIGERIVNDVHPKDRDVAMVFQNYALYPHMSVYKNMAFALKLRKTPRAEIDRRVRETARMLGLEPLLDRKPKALSGGQRQRVALGRAIVREPKAFLFDEPLSNLDAKLRIETRAELKALHLRLKTTTLYVTHDQEEAMTLGDRVVVMSHGRIQQVGSPLEVYRRPANRFVAGFVGIPPMNFIDGRIEATDGRAQLVAAGGAVRIELPRPVADAAGKRVGQPIVLGVRPEALFPADGVAGPRLQLEVGVVEPLGDRMDLYLTAPGGGRLVARTAADDSVRPGQRRAFAIDPERVHLFEPGEWGARIG